ncbi:MAG: hypothetical protein ACOCV2_15475 [Persicimonas sp.]
MRPMQALVALVVATAVSSTTLVYAQESASPESAPWALSASAGYGLIGPPWGTASNEPLPSYAPVYSARLGHRFGPDYQLALRGDYSSVESEHGGASYSSWQVGATYGVIVPKRKFEFETTIGPVVGGGHEVDYDVQSTTKPHIGLVGTAEARWKPAPPIAVGANLIASTNVAPLIAQLSLQVAVPPSR